MSETSPKHVDELTLLRLSDGELTDTRQDGARNHLIACASCRASYEAIKAETGLIRAAVSEADEALPEHIRPRQQDFSWLVVVTLALGTLGISSIWSVVIAPAFSGLARLGVDGAGLGATLLGGIFSWIGWSSLFQTLVEGVVLLLAAAGVGYALQWLWRRVGTSAVSVVMLSIPLLPLAFPSSSQAAVIELDVRTYTLAESDTIDNDLIVMGRTIVIAGTVLGDLIVGASRVEISGEVHGDVLGFAETLIVTGRVRGNVRVGARRLTIDALVARNVTVAAESFILGSEASVEGSLSAAARDVTLKAPVGRDVMLAAAQSTLESRIAGSVLAIGDALDVAPGARLEGTAKFFGRAEPTVSPESSLSSPFEFEQIERKDEPSLGDRLASFFYFWAAAFVFGAAVLLLAPETTEAIVTRHVPSYEKSILTGLVALVGLFGLSLVVALTLVGVPLGILGLTVLGFGLYAAQTFVGAYLGRQLLGTPSTASQGLARLALGLLVVYAAKALPFISFVVMLVVATWGFGAAVSHVREGLRAAPESSSSGEAI